ncbi:hypothetical protein ACFXDH_22065 [Streptomyces sp. NPDC059467]|uniref:hypothetical protein n=1 Tax=Streptomyces sp. NPDC059467 TaxID=3346844 RepID=UPI0036C4FD69
MANAILTASFNLAIFGGGSLGAVRAALLGAVDELHDTAQLSQAAWYAPPVIFLTEVSCCHSVGRWPVLWPAPSTATAV